MNFKQLIKPLLGIALIIIIATVGIKVLTRNDTLADYAKENPELAYATPEPIPVEPSNDQNIVTPVIEAVPEVESTPAPTPEDTTSDVTDEGDLTIDNSETESTDDTTAGAENMNAESFYFTELSDEIKARITGISYPADDKDIAITYDDLRYVKVKYYDFYDEVQDGEIICNKLIAQDIVDIFYELYLNGYQIEKIKLIDEYGGDDTLSMEDNNTSSFNYRVVENTTSLSKHALGLAIDINPFYNPYLVFGGNPDGTDYISPKGSESFVNRDLDFDHKIDKNDLCYKLFKAHGFTWGGDWKSCKDWQHFQKTF